METTTYRVKGMTCDGCVRTLTRALEAALPGAELRVELVGGLVHVTGAHAADAIARAVEDAGFDFDGKA